MSPTIKFAFQSWDNELEWWWPNTVPVDWPDKHNLPTHSVQWQGKMEFFACYDTVEHVLLEDIEPGEKYILPVFIRDSHYFERLEHTGFDCVDRRVLQDAQQGVCKIVLIFPFEGNSGVGRFRRDFEILNRWCTQNGLTRDHVYFIHANQNTAITNEYNFTMVPIDLFMCWVDDIQSDIAHFHPQHDHFLFLNYNRVTKKHRVITTAYLIREKLLDRGLVSYYGNNTKNTLALLESFGRQDLYAEGQAIDNMIPRLIDMDLSRFSNPARNVNKDHYTSTFVSLVSETHTDTDLLFFSEKIWKTISMGHPFMLIGSPGMLASLQAQGYKTFGRWWSEDYDNETDVDSRIRSVVAELKRLSKLSLNELQQIRMEMQPILEFNQRRFNEKWQADCETDESRRLFDIVKNIWESF